MLTLPPRMPSKKAGNKVGDYSLSQVFTNGYHAREDPTTLAPGTLITPSQNVLVGTSGRIGSVAGYVLDGSGSTAIDSGILSNYDFDTFKSDTRNLRCGFLTSAGNDGKLQFRYVNTAGTVSWINLKTGLTNVRLSYASYWDNTNLIKYCVWVDGSNNIFSWTGAVTTVSSNTATTITKQGTSTWQQEGFLPTGSINVNGTAYTYTGGQTTTTLTGLTALPTFTVGAEVHQEPVTTSLSSATGILVTFGPTVVGCGRRNQLYLGSASSNNLYISKVNNYLDYSFTIPTRVAGEGALIPLDAAPTGFLPLEVVANSGGTSAYDLYISEGLSTWAIIRSTLSSDLTSETLEHIRMKVAPLQGAFSERMMGKMQNHIMFIGNDNVGYFYGYNSYEYIPSSTDFSYPIIDDMKSYDFTDGQITNYQNYIYVSIPQSGLIRVYNMTDQTKEDNSNYKGIEDVTGQPWFWEAPVTYPIAGFYVVDGELYGHAYATSESYKLFTGGSFAGQNIIANATFAYDDKGDRTQSKASDEIWVEGYIKQNTILTTTVAGDLDYFRTSQSVTIDGSNPQYVSFGGGGHSLGQESLGSTPLGGGITQTTTLPAWFHVARTYPNVPSYLEQVSFNSNGVDLQWEIIAFGTNDAFTVEGNNSITD